MNTTVANVRAFEVASNGTVANVLAITHIVESAAAYDQKVRDMTNGKLELVPGSLRSVKREVASAQPAVAFHVRAVRESRPYEAAADMTVVQANVFADSDDSVWAVVEANGVKRLVKKTETDIAALLSRVAATNISRVAASTYSANAVAGFQNGNFVLFANADTGEIDQGVGARGDDGNIHVVSTETQELVTIDDAQVIAQAPFAAVAEEGDTAAEVASLHVITAAALDAPRRKRMQEYYAALYSKHPAFWGTLKTQITEMFSPKRQALGAR